jgi:2-iminobutanoate/2-iminopropanoate deaminase
MKSKIIKTSDAPPPAGHYCQAVRASGSFVFISGQTPRQTDGQRLSDASFEMQAHQTLKNLKAVATASGLTLDDAVKVNVYLRRHEDRAEFDRVYREYFKEPSAARALVQSSFIDFDVEVDAILQDPTEAGKPR